MIVKITAVFASAALLIAGTSFVQAQQRAPAASSISSDSTIRTESPRKTNPTVGNKSGLKKMINSFGSKRAPRGASKEAPL